MLNRYGDLLGRDLPHHHREAVAEGVVGRAPGTADEVTDHRPEHCDGCGDSLDAGTDSDNLTARR